MEISLAAETLFEIGPVVVTNSLFSAFIIVGLMVVLTLLGSASIRYEKPGKFQLFLEMIIGGFRSTAKDILGEKKTSKLFSFLFTFFVFIVVSNWFGLLPFVGPIVIEHNETEEETVPEIKEDVRAGELTDIEVIKGESVNENETAHPEEKEVSFLTCLKERDCILTTDGIERIEAFPLFRAPTSDVSATMALSIIAIVAIHTMGFSSLGLGYMKKFINFSNPMSFFVGILELVSEMGKLISFTFRLFGNVFAGEVLLLVITSISFGLATLPFMALEVFVGFIQAFVFFMLTSVFISVASDEH